MRLTLRPHSQSRRALSALLAGLLAVTPPGWATAAPKYKPLDVASTASKLRSGYAARDPQVYRTAMFEALVIMRAASPAWAEWIATAVVAEIKKGKADGLEPLLLAAVDLAATKADKAARARIREAIYSLSKAKAFTDGALPPNLKIPLGRASSYLILDMRSDATRALYDRAIAEASATPDLRSLPDLLTDKTTADALCALPAQKNQLGKNTSADDKRQASCQSGGKPGGAGSGGVSGALGDLTDSGCVLGDPTSDIAALEQRLQAIDKCMEEQVGGRPSPADLTDFEKGLIGGFLSALAVLIFDKGFDVLRDKIKENGAYADALERADRADKAEIQAMNAASKADEAEDKATREYKDAHEKAEQARLEAAAAAGGGNDAELQAAREKLNQAEKDEQATKEKLDKAKADKEAAKEKEQDAADKAKKAKDDADAKKPSEPLDPSDAFKSPACQAALGLPTDRVLRDRLGKDWTDWKSHLKRVSNPNPEGPSPYDSLTTPLCGGDEATIGTPQVACKVAVECNITAMPDASCGCSGVPTDTSRLAQTASAVACRDFHCQDESAPTAKASGRGVVCSCQSGPGSDGGSGTGPSGPRPSPQVIDTLFSTSTQASSANPTADVVRTLFDGRSRR